MLYYDRIDERTIEEIKQTIDVSYDKKLVMLLAIYEKTKSLKQAQIIIREAKENNATNISQLNIMMERIKNKKAKIFDMVFYNEILHWEFDTDLSQQYQQEKIEEETERKQRLDKRIAKPNNGQIPSKEEIHEIRETSPKVANPSQLPKVEARNKNHTSNYGISYEAREAFQKRMKVEDIKPIPKKEETETYEQDVRRLLKRLQKLKVKTYVKMQSQEIDTQKEAIETSDKIDILIDDLKESIALINGKDIEKKEKSRQFLKRICKKFREIEEKENLLNGTTR